MQDLRHLDQRTVALEISIASRTRVVKGVGEFEKVGEFGPALRVRVTDPAGNFEIVLKEREWSGQITTGERFSCDFAVRLDASCLCAQSQESSIAGKC
jgi:hypothetical protein